MQNVLEHLTLSLYRAVADEFYYSFQDRSMESPRRHELKELVGLLRLELDEGTDISVLRSIWDEAGFLSTGMLFPGRAPDQGVREIVLLSSLAQAFRIVTGSITNKQELIDDMERELILSSEYKLISKDIIDAVFGLASGAAVGLGVAELIDNKYKWLAGGVAGIITAFLSNYTFSVTSKKTTKKKRSREYQFIRNTDISSLNRDLPNLIRRMRSVGLAPIFVIDELDKVIPPYDDFGRLIGYMKNLVTDHSFFCFLTDRNYFDFMSSIYQENKYPVEYTYFSNRFYVNYSPRDLHIYLDELFELQTIQDREVKADARLLQYLLLNRAALHTIDLKRELLKRKEDGYISLDGLRSNLYLRFPIMIQLAIELILEDKELVERFDQDSYFFQSIVDTLYYPLRMWLQKKEELDVSKERFAEYMKERSDFFSGNNSTKKTNGKATKANDEEISDMDFLLEKLNELVNLLQDTTTLYNRLSLASAGTLAQEEDEIWKIVINTIPTQKTKCLLKKKSENIYEWRYDYYGRALYKDEENKDIGKKIDILLELDKTLKSITSNEVGLEVVARCGIINTSPSWNDFEFAVSRMRQYILTEQEYPELGYDLQMLDEYFTMVLSNDKNLAKAFILGRAIKLFTGLDKWGPVFEAEGLLFDWRSVADEALIDKLLNQLGREEKNWNIYHLDADHFQDWMEQFKKIGEKGNNYIRTKEDVHVAWWKIWKQRLVENIRDNKLALETTIEDLICTAENYSLAGELRKDIRTISKRTWSDILVRNWQTTPGSTTDVPRWMIIPSLIKLGFTSLDFKELKTGDEEWDNIVPNPATQTPATANEFIIVVSKKSESNYHLMRDIKKPFVIVDYDNYDKQKKTVDDILLFISKKYKLNMLVADMNIKDGDAIMPQLMRSFNTDEDTSYFFVPYGEVASKFKIIRTVGNL